MSDIIEQNSNRCFSGRQLVFTHSSTSLGCEMRFAIYLPSTAERSKVPVLYYLSGLTCNEQNAITKAGAQRYCNDYGVALVCPDTSPRGEGVPDDEADDLGKGAGFYVDATQAPWSSNYQMYTYVTRELPAIIESNFPVTDARGVTGHSMGGHGALVIGLREPQYRTVSALSPIAAPSEVPWGQKAFRAYLGDDPGAWASYDASQLIRTTVLPRRSLLIDVGSQDPFLESQLLPQRLEQAAERASHPLTLRRQPGYDHSYYFISTFIGDHIRHHAE